MHARTLFIAFSCPSLSKLQKFPQTHAWLGVSTQNTAASNHDFKRVHTCCLTYVLSRRNVISIIGMEHTWSWEMARMMTNPGHYPHTTCWRSIHDIMSAHVNNQITKTAQENQRQVSHQKQEIHVCVFSQQGHCGLLCLNCWAVQCFSCTLYP